MPEAVEREAAGRSEDVIRRDGVIRRPVAFGFARPSAKTVEKFFPVRSLF